DLPPPGRSHAAEEPDVRPGPARLLLRAGAGGLQPRARRLGTQWRDAVRPAGGGRGDPRLRPAGGASAGGAEGQTAAVSGPAPLLARRANPDRGLQTILDFIGARELGDVLRGAESQGLDGQGRLAA